MVSTRTRTERGCQGWSSKKEEVLLNGLKEMVHGGWKSENGFRLGYLNALEQYMAKELAGTDLKATPHINSKIHTWKRNHASLVSMISKSDIGYNAETREIDATNDAWADYIKADGNAKGMQNRKWPMFDAWCEVFGKDRATGEAAEGFVEAVNEVLNQDAEQGNIGVNGFEELLEGLEETGETLPLNKSPSATSRRANVSKKRKAVETSVAICDLLAKFHESTEARLGKIGLRIGFEFDMSRARNELWQLLTSSRALACTKS